MNKKKYKNNNEVSNNKIIKLQKINSQLEKQRDKISKKIIDILIDCIYIPLSTISFIETDLFQKSISVYLIIYFWLKWVDKYMSAVKIEWLNIKILNNKKKIFNIKNKIDDVNKRDLEYQKNIELEIINKKKELNDIENLATQRLKIREYKWTLTNSQRYFFDNINWKVNLHI